MGLRALIGMLAPLRFTGAVYLRRRVEHILHDKPPLPNAFYDEFVGEIMRINQLLGFRGIHLKAAVVQHLDRDTIFICAIVDGERSPLCPDDGIYMRLLRRHGVIA